MDVGSIEPLREVGIKNLLGRGGGGARPAHKAHNLVAFRKRFV
jgi:hypothetical protein